MVSKEISNKTLGVLLVFTILVALSGTVVVLSNVNPEFSSVMTGFISSPSTGYATGELPEEEVNETNSSVEIELE